MQPPVYAIMITGKDEHRIAFARLIGIKNFDLQDYKNKHMIIINHGKTPIITKPRENIYEMQVDKNNMTLGDLRNFALELVPLDAIQVTWDDDDWRMPNYMSYMVQTMLQQKAIAIFMKNRLEYNLANNYAFKSSFAYGNTHIMSIKLDRLRYMSYDTLEDTHLQQDIKSFNKKYIALDNNPCMYIRIIHKNNTSPYATDDRQKIVNYKDDSYYKEHEATSAEKEYAKKIVDEYYGFFKY